ncbi:MAG: 3-phosphoglycerate dehydrogenase [Gammaproteobacteria bacterium]|nr:3-phosphoglycerate dehydrogenase [Gammaproteobacteria bacterium]
MYRIRCLNNISEKGLNVFKDQGYELGESILDCDAIILRSHRLSEQELNSEVLAIGRAGAGVNNIPVEVCTDKGVVVFNTPGANANAVKELVLAGLLLSVRGISEGINFVQNLDPQFDKKEMNKIVESSKKAFKGTELRGKTLGVLGLGAIGSKVAETALNLGMKVLGYDPALSVEAAWKLSSQVERIDDLPSLFAGADIVTLHIPASKETIGIVGKDLINNFKNSGVLLNFSREEIVDEEALRQALASGKVKKFISDFPTPGISGLENVISMPHLGASTYEAEENCAFMVASQITEFLKTGNISNSVNFPEVSLERTRGSFRIAVVNRNVPKILGNVLSALAEKNINVLDMLNKSKNEIAYNLIDIDTVVSNQLLDEISGIEGVVSARGFH